MTETGLSKNQILSELSKSPHGKLSEYVLTGKKAAAQEPEFFAHLIAWDRVHGQIRDAKVALPVVSLAVPEFHEEFVENSLAHIALLGPREFKRAFEFAKEIKVPGRMRQIRRLLRQYLEDKQKDGNEWRRMIVQHRATLKWMFRREHIEPNLHTDTVLMKNIKPKGTVFEAIANLKNMDPKEAAGAILRHKIPFMVAKGALGANFKDNVDLVFALIKQMSPTELVTSTKILEKWGMKTNPALRGAYDEAMERASTSQKNVLKTTRAAEAISDEGLKQKLQGLQDRQLKAMSGIEGNWLVLGDRSPSMSQAIEVATEVAGTLAKLVKGKVHLVFFDSTPQTMEVTGLPLEEIKKKTRHIVAGGGGTSIGCGLQRMLDSNIEVDGIAIISDAQENTAPAFVYVYQLYMKKFDKQVPVYLYRCQASSRGYSDLDLAETMRKGGFDLQEFDIRHKTDYYALPDLARTMRTNRYSLADEIMGTPLLTLKDVFKSERKGVLTSVGAT
jgi:hypothetical protein